MSLLRRVRSLLGIGAAKTVDSPSAVNVLGTDSPGTQGSERDSKPDAAEQSRRQGNAALQEGRLEIALSCYERFAELQPDNPSAHLNIGFALFSMQRYPQAEAALHRSLQLDASSHETHFFLGCAKAEQGDLRGATVSLSQAVTLAPQFDAGWLQLGIIQERQGEWAQASQCYRRAVAQQPSVTEGWKGLTRIALAQRLYPQALEAADRWLQLDARSATAHGMRADALRRLGRRPEALEASETAVSLNHVDPTLWQVQGWSLIDTGQHTLAKSAFERALALAPQSSAALAGLGSALLGLNRPDDALTVFERLAALDPEYEDLSHNRSLCLMHALRFHEARSLLQDAVARAPNNAQLHFDLAIAELTLGDYEAGWRSYEWRFALNVPQAASQDSASLPASWQAGVSVNGKRILIASEQGLGDSIQFVRYVPLLINHGARVTLQVQARLKTLLEGNWDHCELVSGPLDGLAHFDLECKLMSLPFLLGISTPVSMGAPYVHSDAMRRGYWRARLGERRKPTVGLVWAGNPDHPDDARRSVPLELFRIEAPESIQFVSLQFDIRDSDQAALSAWPELLHFGSEQRDLADTAALIENLDAVVCVDTSVAHLSGALGVPVFILLQYFPDWRWRLERDDTPWYPSARLIRQDVSRQWRPVIHQAMNRLGELSMMAIPDRT